MFIANVVQTLHIYFPLQFVKNRITTIQINSVLADGRVIESQEMSQGHLNAKAKTYMYT